MDDDNVLPNDLGGGPGGDEAGWNPDAIMEDLTWEKVRLISWKNENHINQNF